MPTWFYRIHDLSRPPRDSRDRNDQGFSFAQVIVTMVIVGILGGIGTFAAFQYIGQSRETVLSANVQTAAAAVQNTLALDPGLKSPSGYTMTATGAPPSELISALSSASSGFTWSPPDSTSGNYRWDFEGADGQDVVRIQMIRKASPHDDDDGCAGACSSGLTPTDPNGAADNTTPATVVAPKVRWLVADGDAVRIQIKNDDGAWACALIVLRPDWNTGMIDGTVTAPVAAEAEGNLRGIWYDAGANLRGDTSSHPEEANGRHHCSPTTVGPHPLSTGEYGMGSTAVNGHDPLPASGAEWNIPFNELLDDSYDGTENSGTGTGTPPNRNDGGGNDILGRTLQRTVPAFDAT